MSSSELRTAIYARYSSHNQDDGTSIAVQLDICRRAAGGACREYVDRAITGTTMSREEFDRMLGDCQAGLIDTLYVYKWDRFGRSARAHVVVEDLEQLGVRVISATEGHEPLSRGIQLVVAEDYSRKLSERVTAAKRRRFEEGTWHGGVPLYGYRVENKRLVPDDGGEAEVVRLVFDIYLNDNIGFKQIARQLNERGIKPRRAKLWTAGTVRTMLSNSTYAGRPAACGKADPTTQWRRRMDVDDPNRRERYDESLRIVSDEQFDQAQKKLKSRPSARPTGQNRTRRFSKLITCSECGGTFIRRYSAKDEANAQWACGVRVRVDRSRCSNQIYMREAAIVEFIDQGFKRLFDDTEAILAEATAEAERLAQVNRREAKDLQKRVAALEAELDRLAGLLMDPDLSDPATKRLLSGQVAAKTEERDRLQARHGELAHDANDATERLAAAVRQALEEARQSLANVTSDSEFNQFVRDFVGPLVIAPDGTIAPKETDESVPRVHVAEATQYRPRLTYQAKQNRRGR